MCRATFNHNKICSCFNCFCIVIGPVFYIADMMCILCKGIIDKSTVRQRSMMASGIFRHGMIDSASDHFLPGTHDFFLNVFVEGKHHYAARVPVQTVNNKRPVGCSVCAFLPHDFFKNIYGRAGLASRIWNRQKARRFVDYNYILVFIENLNAFLAIITLVFPFILRACLYMMECFFHEWNYTFFYIRWKQKKQADSSIAITAGTTILLSSAFSSSARS